MTTMDMPAVHECTVTGCSYNHDGCHAFAITVSGVNGTADCGTFVPLDTKGGLPKVVAQVGACSRSDCSHNKNLECSASSVRIGPGKGDHAANCLTYTTD
ncbi:DUF1540 domain-containing protein [Actinosynnema pretiosum subsp. pretiosum]|uniref:DUF1540 domain-containing protein n=2 Tax=Actinosynnema TaxID=40566 RepID=C6WL40_ACTMD|nr:DUF1540 domain-containing protein [Actinosynnema mirum]ACU36393.1 conserved hypothetical protein [Actinosynnema mirum DSM 43827]QUF05953.1 DUF1540 domain-containing protein [Actinosynnema pretiosum subsp. pretiosum]